MVLFDRSKLTNENLIKIFVMILIYILFGNLSSIVQTQKIPQIILAANLVIIATAGILFGKEAGLIAGIMGPLINGVITADPFEYASIIPYLVTGWTAGKLKEENHAIISSFAVTAGYLLNVCSFLGFKLITIKDLDAGFWKNLGYETLLGTIIMIIISLGYLKISSKKNRKKK
jgi:hypothetical protein